MSFASISADNVLISTIKKCEDDDGVIVRCYDIEGKNSEVTLKMFKSHAAAERTNIIEEEGQPVPVDGNTVKLNIGHHAIETLKIIP
jgi:alpha-mannosidase